MRREQIELEFTFTPPDDAALPDLSSLLDVESVDPPQDYDLEAVYFDTPELSLSRSGLSLRRRFGGVDDGWHLKVPTIRGRGRTEISMPLGRVVVARIHTKRRALRLRAADGSVLAELCDDTVHGESLMAANPQEVIWREWELELGSASEAMMRQALDVLEAVAGKPVSGGSKLVRTLGVAMSEVRHERTRKLTRSARAGAIVARRLSEQVEALKNHDSEVRREAPDGVHQARVTIRRLRSALATFRPLLDRSKTEPVRDELQWIGQILGDARDAEVLRSQLPEMLDRDPAELVLGRVRGRINAELKSAYQDARARALEALESPRYFQLLDTLDELIAVGAWSPVADRAAGDVLPRCVRRDVKRLRKRVQAAQVAETDVADALLHDARKAAKRVRYASETLRPIYGKDAKRLARRMKSIQSGLGDHHDSVVARHVLRELAVKAHREGDNGFTYGRLHGLEQARGGAAVQRFDEAWAKAEKPRVHRWLK
jgi:CHAD domain-containing protein